MTRTTTAALEQLMSRLRRKRARVALTPTSISPLLSMSRPSFKEAYSRFLAKVGTIPAGTADALEGLRQHDLTR